MKISLNWIRNYISIPWTVDELAHRLSMSGFPVEEISTIDPFPGVIIGKVEETQKHPNADKLTRTKVDTGKEILSIVCGAPNVKPGQYVPVATVGTRLPGGLEIKQAKIRGEVSNGMICSKSELGFEEGKSDGIWELEEKAQTLLGQPFAVYLGISDTVITLDVTSNRPDCLSMIGIAREIAVLQEEQPRLPDIEVPEEETPVENLISVRIDDTDGCSRYAARVIRGIQVGPSPEWLVRLLESVGMRSVNNIVDVTNFVMLEFGQPLHAFDYDRVAGHQIIVRASKPGESFQTLDEKIHILNEPAVLICDAEKPVALGGIMGGMNSEISEQTKNVLLESAYFNPARIRPVMKKTGLVTEASLRFSRGADPEITVKALNRATQLIARITGAKAARGVVDVKAREPELRQIVLRHSAVSRLLGQTIEPATIRRILEKLECTVREDSQVQWTIIPPSFRSDLNAEHDCIEEIARIYGYDQLPSANQAPVYYLPSDDKEETTRRKIHRALQASGFYEAVTFSMVNPKTQSLVAPIAESRIVRLLNPINEDLSVMRWSLLPGLLEVIRHNLFQKNMNVRVYELGRIFLHPETGSQSSGLPGEFRILAGCACGSRYPVRWDEKPRAFDFYDLRQTVESLLSAFTGDPIRFIPLKENPAYTPTALAVEWNHKPGNSILGHFGKVNPNILKRFDIDTEVWAFEFSLDRLTEKVTQKPLYRPIPRYPSIRRDLAVVVDRTLKSGDLSDAIRETAGVLLCEIDVFDVYTGEPIPSDKKSLAFSLRFQSTERTLVEEEVDQIMKTILRRLEKDFHAQIR